MGVESRTSYVGAALPLGRELLVGKLRRALEGIGLRWLVLALLLRVLLSPLQHPWDSQTWWNVVAELGPEANPIRAVATPYERMRELSEAVRANGSAAYYEYWAYPPGMLVFWWPLARAWTLAAGSLDEQFDSPQMIGSRPIPLALALAMKLPIIIADFAAALLLSRLAGPVLARSYLLNPYVLLVGLWTFDPVMLAFMLGAVVAAARHRWLIAGVLVGLGAAVKFTAALLVLPVALIALRSASAPTRRAILVAVAASATFFLVCLPWLDGVKYVVEFHARREGGGLSWQTLWRALAGSAPVHLDQVSFSAQLGAVTLVAALGTAACLIWVRRLNLVEACPVVVLAFLAGSKLVNEVYALPAFVLASILATSGDRNAILLAAGLWIVPFFFALSDVPAWAFFIAPAQALGLISPDTAWAYRFAYGVIFSQLPFLLGILGAGFQVFCLWGIWQIAFRARSTVQSEAAIAA